MKTKLLLLVCLVCVLLLPSLSVRADALPEQEPTPTNTKISPPPVQTDPIDPIDPVTPSTPTETMPLSVLVTIGLGVLVVIVLVVSGFVIGEIKKNSGKP